MYYQIQLTVTRNVENGSTSRGIPTFYLDANVQGIISAEHAADIARSMFAIYDEVHGTAYLSETGDYYSF